MRLSYGRNRLKSVLAPLVGSLVAVLVVMGLGWAVLHLYFSPQVSRVDPAVLSELRAIGQVVGEDSIVGHQWENNYVEMNDLVIYLDGNAKEDVVTEAAHRLKQRGWHVSRRESSEIRLESTRWPYALVTVEQLQDKHMSSELREQVISTGLHMSHMAYISVQP